MSSDLMQAVRADAAGDPALLRVIPVARPEPGEGEVLIKVHAAGVNRSDVLACRGVLPGPFPRILGRDFAGEVVAGPPEWAGRRVWGTGGGDIGLSQDGSHAQFLLAPASAICPIPAALSFVEAAASGLSYFTASAAWERAGGIPAGQTVVVTGAVGGVGGAAACLAAERGARVIGVVLAADEATAAENPALGLVIRSDVDDVASSILEATDGKGALTAVDTVGGPLTVAVLGGMAIRGGVCVLSTPPAKAVASLDILDFYRRELHLTGLHTGRLTAADAARALVGLTGGFASGALVPTRVHGTYRLEDAARAYQQVEQAVRGRPVLVPAHG